MPVATGRNFRDEQNAVLTALGQLIFKDALRKLLTCRSELTFTVSKELEKAFVDYLWEAQQAETGYWGPSYTFDGEIVSVPDLSFTFHIVHYYMDGTTRTVPNLDKIVTTTLAIRDEVYPNGWLEKDGKAAINKAIQAMEQDGSWEKALQTNVGPSGRRTSCSRGAGTRISSSV